MIRWIKTLFRIVRDYDKLYNQLEKDIQYAKSLAEDAAHEIRERTDIHADWGVLGPSTIILTGVYNKRDYVEVFHVDQECFNDFANRLTQMKKYGQLRRLDVPIDFKYYANEVKEW